MTYNYNEMKEQFNKYFSNNVFSYNSAQLSAKKYNTLVENVKAAKSATKKLNKYYWLLKHYDVLNENGKERLIAPIVNGKILYYVVNDDLFDILYNLHLMVGHGGRDRMRKELKKMYKNVTVIIINFFLSLCGVCMEKKKTEKKVLTPTTLSHFKRKCQVDLLDYQTQCDEEYNFILIYQDLTTKFTILKALRTNNIEEVAGQILEIFLLFDAPDILQSESGSEFCSNIIENIKAIFPNLTTVYDDASNNLLQNDLQRSNLDVENMLTTWMLDNQCNNWSKGLGFVQLMLNRTLNSEIKQSPHEAMFYQTSKINLRSSKMLNDIILDFNVELEPESDLDAENRILPVKEVFSVDNEHMNKKNHKLNQDLNLDKMKKCNCCETKLEMDDQDICILCSNKINNDHLPKEENENVENVTNQQFHISSISKDIDADSSSSTIHKFEMSSKRATKRHLPEEDYIVKNSKVSDATTQHHLCSDYDSEIIAKVWALEFRKLKPEVQLFVKKSIDDILYEARLGKYSIPVNKPSRIIYTPTTSTISVDSSPCSPGRSPNSSQPFCRSDRLLPQWVLQVKNEPEE